MFDIVKKNNNGLKILLLINKSTGESVSIVPDFGANVNALILKKHNVNHSILEGNLSRGEFEGKNIFRGANLIPFPNRIQEGRYSFQDEQYQLEKNYPEEGNACHGFIYDKTFEIIDQKIQKDFCEIVLGYNYDGELPGYPFPFRVKLFYTLNSTSDFIRRTIIENTGPGPMPIGNGWHPFFKLCDHVNGLMLKLPKASELIPMTANIPNIEKDRENFPEIYFRIQNNELDSCYYLTEDTTLHYTIIYDESENIGLELWQEAGPGKYNYLQIYTPPDRRSIALEPMSCNVNAFNNQEGLVVLKTGEKFDARFGIKLV